jgi:type II secretory pathway pseudopilin PulG
MPIGKPHRASAITLAPAARGLRRQRGFTYLWLLFILAAGGAVLGVLGQRWSTALQREREHELIWRGRQIAAAISAYRAAPGVGDPQWPQHFEDLIEDRRSVQTRHHLRRVWTDPLTGKADWVFITTEDGRWQGLHSRSNAVAWVRTDLPAAPALSASASAAARAVNAASAPRVSAHVFMAAAPASAASPPLVLGAIAPAMGKPQETESP